MKEYALTSLPTSADVQSPRKSVSWGWPIAVLALCHGQAIASFQILNILVDPIRASLHISDTQYSLLQGFAVAIFSAALGIPAARWADRHSRRNVILIGAVGWSLATAASGFVASFAELFAARVAMGIGEVFLFPAALALIAELVPRSRLSIAIACFGVGGPIGGAVAMFGGGWLVAHSPSPDGWRLALIACGLSGTLSAALLLTVVEPPRVAEERRQSFAAVLSYVGRRWPLYLPVSAGMICLSLCAFAGAAWVPTAMARVYRVGSASVGELSAASSLFGGVFLASSAGWLVDTLTSRGDRAGPLTVSTGLCVVLAGLVVSAVLLLSGGAAIILWLVAYSLLGVPTVLGGTAFQMITAAPVRAQVMAIYLLLMNILALSLGPFLVAFLTDYVFRSPEHVHQSIALVVSFAAVLGGLCLVIARNRFFQATRCDTQTMGALVTGTVDDAI